MCITSNFYWWPLNFVQNLEHFIYNLKFLQKLVERHFQTTLHMQSKEIRLKPVERFSAEILIKTACCTNWLIYSSLFCIAARPATRPTMPFPFANKNLRPDMPTSHHTFQFLAACISMVLHFTRGMFYSSFNCNQPKLFWALRFRKRLQMFCCINVVSQACTKPHSENRKKNYFQIESC